MHVVMKIAKMVKVMAVNLRDAHLFLAVSLAQILVAAYQSVHLVDVCPCYAVVIENQNAQILVAAFQNAVQVHLVVVKTCFAVMIEKQLQNQNAQILVAVCQSALQEQIVIVHNVAQKNQHVKMILDVYQSVHQVPHPVVSNAHVQKLLNAKMLLIVYQSVLLVPHLVVLNANAQKKNLAKILQIVYQSVPQVLQVDVLNVAQKLLEQEEVMKKLPMKLWKIQKK